MKFLEKYQHLLPIGYLYLIILGLIKESVTFYQLGINILKYSNIMDILISPVADLFSHPLIFVTVLLFGAYGFLLQYIYKKWGDKKWSKLFTGMKHNSKQLSEEELAEKINQIPVRFIAIGLLSFFLGFGFQAGRDKSQQIKNNTMKFKHRINFTSGESTDVFLLENNSSNYIFVRKGSKSIEISPVGNIKSIEFIENKKLK